MISDSTYRAVRDELRMALRSGSNDTLPGQLNFSLSDITKKTKPSKRLLPKEDPENEDEPEVWITPEAIQTGTQKQFKTSTCPIHEDVFYFNQLISELSQIKSPYQQILLYGYGDDREWLNVELLTKTVWSDFLALSELEGKKYRAKKLSRLKGMVLLALQEWKSLITYEKPAYTPARIRQLIGVSEHQWRRDWLPFWRMFLGFLDQYDREAVYQIYLRTRYGGKKERDSDHIEAA